MAGRPSAPPPLLVWTELAAIDRLQAERQDLKHRIERLPPHSFRRIELEARLRVVTARQLQIQTEIGDNR